jgi:hypothetical protein
LVEKFEPAPSGTFREEFGELLADAFRGNDADFFCMLADSGERCGFNCVVEASGEAHGAQHAKLVFSETAGWFTNGADNSGGKIGAAADEIEELFCVVTHKQAIDGEIAALHVFFGCPGINNLVGMAAVRVADIGAEGGDFDFAGILADEDDTELGADIEAAGKQEEYFNGSGIRGDIVIGGLATEKNISHTAADKKGLVPVTLKRVADRIGEVPGIHGMIMRLWGR